MARVNKSDETRKRKYFESTSKAFFVQQLFEILFFHMVNLIMSQIHQKLY